MRAVGDEAGGAKEMPKEGEVFSKPSVGDSVSLGLLERSAIVAADLMRRAVWGPLLLPLAAALPEGVLAVFCLPPNRSRQFKKAKARAKLG